MKKPMIYVIAVLACVAYIITITLFLQLILNIDFDELAVLWKILLLGVPVLGIWSSITRQTKKNDNNGHEQDDSKH